MFNLTKSPSVLLLGARGAVGSQVRRLLHEAGAIVITAGRREGDDVAVDLAADDVAAYAEATRGVGAVVNASGREDERLAGLSAAPFVDISASAAYLRRIDRIAPRAGALGSVGLAPGLSTLLAAELARRAAAEGDEIDLALVLGVGEAHGAAAVEWTARLLGARFHSPADGRPVKNLTEARRFRLPVFGRRTLVRADFSDTDFATTDRIAVRNYLAVSSRAATLALRAATHLPALAPLVAGAHLSGTDTWALTATARRTGATVTASGSAQSLATAEITALATRAVLARPPASGRLTHLPDLLTLTDVVAHTSIRPSPY